MEKISSDGFALRKIFQKLLRGTNPSRRSRFHTEEGALPPLRALLSVPISLWQIVRFRLTGRRPETPWIPFSAIRYIRRQVRREWRVLEIGSGMSTLWFAERCAEVDSIEADVSWHERLVAELAARGSQARVHYRWRWDHMCDFSMWPDRSLDLLFVDGGPRPECVEAGLAKVRPGGLIYVDNTDQPRTSGRSKDLLIRLAREPGTELTTFRDFVPGNLFVNEGMLLRLAERPV
jgi:hypothetical protein